MKISIVGTGYVGLVTGACLADAGNEVLCLDLDPHKIQILESGGI
ncbi:MAG: 2-dehydropantoate 2-reductase N-terminal domain-containing protein, partial [Burkholderiaceae bacterium]